MDRKNYKYYVSNGLTVKSNIRLPELPSCEERESFDVTIKLRRRKNYAKLDSKSSLKSQYEKNEIIYAVPDVAYFKISNGSKIDIYPKLEVKEKIIRNFVIGICYGALLYQRGYLVLHASSVSVGGKSILFIGEKGAGKSTTASFFMRKSYSLVSDDVVAVETDKKPTVIPTARHIKLSKEAADLIKDMSIGYYQAHPYAEKIVHIFDYEIDRKKLEVSAIFSLISSKKLHVLRLSSLESFQEVAKHSYINISNIPTKNDRKKYFHKISDLVKRVPVYRLHRPVDFCDSYDIVESIENVVDNIKV